jgi:ligand-binding sensor domain-containing protein
MLKQMHIVLLCLCCSLSFQLAAQQYGYVQYHSGSGAPFDQVSSVVQDQAGFIWIGSQNGLYRFDGVHFDIHSMNTESQFIYQLQEDEGQLLFINDIGIYQIEGLHTEPLVKPLLEGTINETAALPFYPNDFITSKDESIWISQSNHSIGRFQQGDFQKYPFSKTDKEQKLAIQEDAEGDIWVLSPLDGLFRFNNTSNAFEKKLGPDNGNALLVHNDYLLLGNDALQLYSIQDNEPRLIKKMELGQDDLITTMYVDDKGQYFVGTQKGKLFIMADFNSPLQTIYGASEAHRVEELNFGHIHEIYVTTDSSSNHDRLWVASATGLWLLQERFFKTVEKLPMVNPINIVMGKAGRAWAPINYLFEITPHEDEFTARPVLDDLQVNAVAEDKAGFIWVATSTPRIALLKYAGNQLIKRYDEFHERGESIFNLFPDSKGNLWICQAPLDKPIVGIARINTEGVIEYYDETRGFNSRVLAIKESSRGEIYTAGIGEKSYLYRFDPEQGRFMNLSLPLPFEAMLNFEAHDLTIDDRGIVWLATTDGLLCYDGEKITLIQNDVLGQEEVRGVTHYSNNNIWIATATKGLVFHQQNTSTTLGETEGLPAIISAYRCIATDAKGHLWAGMAEGLVYSRISAATLPYSNSPKIRALTIGHQELTRGFYEGLQLKKDQQLHLSFTNLSYPAKNVQYQYRLVFKEDKQVMLDEQLWQSNGNNNELVLDQLELGDYYLELRALQPGGVPMESSD